MSTNATTLIGNVTRDPEFKFLGSGSPTVKLGIAVNRRWQKNGEWQEQTSFFDVTAYGQLAENVANCITKGTRIVVTGRMEQRSWETPDGDKRSIVEIVADDIAPSLAYATAVVTKTTKPQQGAAEAF